MGSRSQVVISILSANRYGNSKCAFIYLCSGTQETTNTKVKVLCLHSNPNPVPVSMNHVSRGHEMGCARMIRERCRSDVSLNSLSPEGL